MLHSDILPDQACDGELLPIVERSTARARVVRCFRCDTEITTAPDCDWLMVRYPGMRSGPEE